MIVEAKNVGIALATARLFNEEYRQKIFVFIRHWLLKMV